MDIEASARKHGVSDHDMLHAIRNHWKAFETDDPAVTMYVGRGRFDIDSAPSRDGRAARGRRGR